MQRVITNLKRCSTSSRWGTIVSVLFLFALLPHSCSAAAVHDEPGDYSKAYEITAVGNGTLMLGAGKSIVLVGQHQPHAGSKIMITFSSKSGLHAETADRKQTFDVILLNGVPNPIDEILANCLKAASNSLAANTCRHDAVNSWIGQLKQDEALLNRKLPKQLSRVPNVSHSGYFAASQIRTSILRYIRTLASYKRAFSRLNRYASMDGGTASTGIALDNEIKFLKLQDQIALNLLLPTIGYSGS